MPRVVLFNVSITTAAERSWTWRHCRSVDGQKGIFLGCFDPSLITFNTQCAFLGLCWKFRTAHSPSHHNPVANSSSSPPKLIFYVGFSAPRQNFRGGFTSASSSAAASPCIYLQRGCREGAGGLESLVALGWDLGRETGGDRE